MQIGRIYGIPLRIDWSWLLVFALLVWTLSTNLGPLAAIPAQWRGLAASLTVLTFFACVIAHEVAHALVARRFGIKTREIVLFVFGGVSRMERVGTTAWSEAAIALAGPAASVALGVAFMAAAALMPAQSAAVRVSLYLAVINVLVAGFNLLPAYPIDGGRIVHAIAWHLTSDRVRATRIAVAVSTVAGVLLASAGATLLLRGYAVSGVWTILIAWFILRTGQAELVNEFEIEPLKKLRCGDVADPAGSSITPDTICDRALEMMASGRRRVLPVSAGDEFIGLLTLSDFAKIPRSNGAGLAAVGSIMTPAAQVVRVTPDTDALQALKELADSAFHQLPVVNQRGELSGFITSDTIRRAVAFNLERQRLGLAAAANYPD